MTEYTADQQQTRAEAMAQYKCIADLLNAVQVDFEQLETLRDDRDSHDTDEHDGASWADVYPEESAELATLEAAAGDYADEDEARTALLDNALDVQVRSGWTAPGQQLVPGEFMLLLCTGGPAVRIVGELEDGTVTRAWMEYSDWSTSWTECFAEGIDNDVLAEYAGFFFA